MVELGTSRAAAEKTAAIVETTEERIKDLQKQLLSAGLKNSERFEKSEEVKHL